MVTLRRFRDTNAPTLWALHALPNIGATAALVYYTKPLY
jgi:hypothetical protein